MLLKNLTQNFLGKLLTIHMSHSNNILAHNYIKIQQFQIDLPTQEG